MLNNLYVRAVLTGLVLLIDLLLWGGDTRTWNGYDVPVWLVIILGAVGYSVLFIRRSPIPGYIALLVLSLGGLILPTSENFAGFLFALFLMARLTPRRTAFVALAGAIVPIGVNTYTGLRFHPDDPLTFTLLSTGLWMLFMLGVWFTGRVLVRTDHRLVTERRWAEAATEEARAMERMRMSRDLHDTVAHSLTAIVLQIAGIRASRKNPKSTIDVDQVLGDIQTTAEQSMRELHRLLGMLRSIDPDDDGARPHGLADIDALVDTAKTSGMAVTTRATGEAVPLDPSLEHTAYRVIQEGLSNAMKHAGDGAQVQVTQDWEPARLTVSVRSISGVSTTNSVSGGYGLIGLRERISVSGGTLHNGPTPNGYLLQAVLPTTVGLPTAEPFGESS